MRREDFLASDGKTLKLAVWDEVKEPKGIVQIAHGMAEHIGRYDAFARYLNENGFIVAGDDHRAHGLTAPNALGKCGDYDLFERTVEDEREITIFLKRTYSLPVILFGHSYGSFLTQAFLEYYGDRIDGAVIGGSAKMQGFQVVGGSLVANMACLFGRAKKEGKLLANMSFGMYNKKFSEGTFISSLVEECEKYNNTWGCGFVLSNNFYRGFFKGLKTLYKKKNYVKIDTNKPLLLISGSNDPVGNMGKSVKDLYNFYADTIGVKEVDCVLYEGVRHEYFNDTSKQKAFDAVLDFCNGLLIEE